MKNKQEFNANALKMLEEITSKDPAFKQLISDYLDRKIPQEEIDFFLSLDNIEDKQEWVSKQLEQRSEAIQ